MLYVLLLSLCCFCRAIIKLNASQGHNLSAEVQRAAKVPMRRSHQGLISWIFSVNTRMVLGLELNLEVTDFQLLYLAGTSAAWCLQVKSVVCFLENIFKIAHWSTALQVKDHYAKFPNTCMLCLRWGPSAHCWHFATSGHAAMTYWCLTATTEVKPGLLLYMVLLKIMPTMSECFKPK